MKSILIILLLIVGLSPAYSQHRKKKARKKPVEYQWVNRTRSYDAKLVANIDQMQFDSVKIFSFGCPSDANRMPPGLLYKESIDGNGGYILSMGLVDATQHWLPMLSDAGQVFTAPDLQKMFKILKEQHLDTYYNDPAGCFEPHMGIVFYKGVLVNAHMDVCLTCNNIIFERFDDGKVIYKYEAVVMGSNTLAFFQSLVSEYKLVTCSH